MVRYKSLTRVNGTLASHDRLLSGTSSNPTLLKYGIVRGKLTDNSTRTNAVATSDTQTDFGLRLSWRGPKIEDSKEGPSTPYHYVAFQFSTPYHYGTLVVVVVAVAAVVIVNALDIHLGGFFLVLFCWSLFLSKACQTHA